MLPLRRTAAAIALCLLLFCQPAAADVEGLWLSGDGDGWIEIRREGDMLIGIIAGSPNTQAGDPPRLDDKNPDPALRQRKLDGLTIMTGFRYEGDNRWGGGTIYDPNSGNTYRGTLTLIDDDTLKVRGYIGVPLFGRSDTWQRDSREPD
jgi:uncharacterized protein (DUF2147 family)